MAGLVVVCAGGVKLDNWDCSNKSVYTAWKINSDCILKVLI